MSDASNAKEKNYKFYLNRKNTKLIKQPKIIFQLPKTIEKPNIVDIKSVNIISKNFK